MLGFLKIRRPGADGSRTTPDDSINSRNNAIGYQNTLADLDVKAIGGEGHNLLFAERE